MTKLIDKIKPEVLRALDWLMNTEWHIVMNGQLNLKNNEKI